MGDAMMEYLKIAQDMEMYGVNFRVGKLFWEKSHLKLDWVFSTKKSWT